VTPRGTAGPLLESSVAGVAWAMLVLGLAVYALTLPAYTRTAAGALGTAATAGLSNADTLALSERVRAFVAEQDADALPSEWGGAPAFDEAAVSHLEDVRTVLAGARLATGAAAAALAAYLAWCVSRRRWDVFARGMRAGAVVAGVVVGVAGLAAVLDFGALFTAFHGLFFEAGTWTFPYDSLLIRLFPERFWVAAGAALALLTLFGAGVLVVAARYVPHAVLQVRGSRTPEDV